MTWDINSPYKAESKKVWAEVAPYLSGRGVDLGAGTFKVIPHAISVDNNHHAMFGHNIKPDIFVEDCIKLDVFASQSMDYVYSSHLLEHIENHSAALKEWFRLVKLGGYLILYLPDEEEYPKVGENGANPDHKWNVNYDRVIKDMESVSGGWDLIDFQKRNKDDEYSLLFVFKKIQGRTHEFSWELEKPTKTALVCRFGAFGDLIQASSVFAGLKKEGYHVTLMTSKPGCEVVMEDPNIDAFIIQDRDQVPNGDLLYYWNYQAKKYDKFVNLSESVEGVFLVMPDRTESKWWTPEVRHKHKNQNYVQHQHEIAGIPHDPKCKFYATKEEKAWAKLQRSRMGKHVILWSLAGSSIHKTWAGLDSIIAAVMLNYKDVDIVLCGGPEASILEAGWEKEPRVHLTCGRWSIRQTMSFIAESDLVIGPETGILNAAGHEEMPKILFLSHSSEENLSRDWIDTVSLHGKNTNCKGRGDNKAPACHLMHFNWDNCTQDKESGTAQCQKDISEEEVWWHVSQILDRLHGNEWKAA